MWSIDTVATLPLQDFYQDSKRVAAPFLVTKHDTHKHHGGRSRKKRGVVREKRGFFYTFIHQWIICSGGLITMILSGLFSFHTLYLPLRYPSRYQKRALYYSVTIVLITCFLQSLLCSFYCDSSHNE